MTLLDEPVETPALLVLEDAPARRRRFPSVLAAVAGLLLAVGALGVGTMASFSASTDNRSTAFSVGTLVLSNSVDGATACLSNSGPGGVVTNDAECDGLFSLAVAEPGDGDEADIDLVNEGSIDGTLALHALGACVDGDAAGTVHHGTGSLCSALRLSIQSYASEADRAADDTTGGSCIYGGGTATTCAFDDPAATAANFASAYGSFTDTIDLGPMAASGPTEVRFLRVSVELPATAGNPYQGRTADFGLTWRLVQG